MLLVMADGDLIQRVDPDTLAWRWPARLDPALESGGVFANGIHWSATLR
jgi:hypothetical protein